MRTQCACSAARQVARVLTQLYDARLRAGGLEAPQFALMLSLEQCGPLSQVALARGHDMEKTTVSRNLKLLEAKGWIALSEVEDRRVRQFKLTAAGRKQLAAAKPKWKKAQDELLASMGAGKWKAMFEAFQGVIQAAKSIDQARGKTI